MPALLPIVWQIRRRRVTIGKANIRCEAVTSHHTAAPVVADVHVRPAVRIIDTGDAAHVVAFLGPTVGPDPIDEQRDLGGPLDGILVESVNAGSRVATRLAEKRTVAAVVRRARLSAGTRVNPSQV